MQTLWSRTLRATKCTCRCQQCLSYSTAVARRTTDAVRKRLTSIPSSTLLYSAIFACAAVADGRAKQQRREKWDHAIEEAKQKLGPGDADMRTLEGREAEEDPDDTERQTKVRKVLSSAAQETSGFEDIDPGEIDAEDLAAILQKEASGVEDPAAAEKIMRKKLDRVMRHALRRAKRRGADNIQYEASHQELAEWENAKRYSMLQADRPEWPENTGPYYDGDSFPPQSIHASDRRKLEGLESRWTRRKLQTMNHSMAKLVLRMVQEADLSLYPLLRKWDSSLPPVWIPDNVFWVVMKEAESKQKLLAKVNTFLEWTKLPAREENIPEYKPIFGRYPFYEQDAQGEFHRRCYAMNKRIFEVFDECFNGVINIPTLVARVSEELLTASAPPNITTYNALILGFTRLRQGVYTDMVLDSLHEVHMRPDEITCAAALTHYINANDSRQFNRFVQLMTGISNTNYALMLARPTLSLSHASTIHKLQNRVFRHPRRPDRLVQKVHPTPRVMDAVVAGLLKFHGLERAINICATLTADGWGFDADGLTRFLHACAERADWDAGRAVWHELQVLRRRRPPNRPLDRDTYLHMLGLCWRCERPDVFEQVLTEAHEIAGYKAGALEKDFEKMRRNGWEGLESRAGRKREWLLRHDMAAKFEAEGRLVQGYKGGGGGGVGPDAEDEEGEEEEEKEDLKALVRAAKAQAREEMERERRAAAATADGVGQVAAERTDADRGAEPPPPPLPPSKWKKIADDGFGDGDDEITWRPREDSNQQRPAGERGSPEDKADGVLPTRRWMTTPKRGKKGDWGGDDWGLD